MSIRQTVDTLLRGMGQIMLQDNALTGLLFLLGILVSSWQMFFAALLGLAAVTATAWLLRYERKDIEHGLYGFNAALVGVGLLFFYQPGVLLAILIIIGAALSAMIMHFMHWRRMSPFTFPFVLSAWAVIAFAGATGLLYSQPSSALPAAIDIVSALSLGFSQVMFQPNVLTGILFLVAIAVNSRTDALYALLGSVAGTAIAMALSFPASFIAIGLFGYNAVLCGIAFTGKEKRMLALAILSIALSVFIVRGFQLADIPPLTAPFVFATWITLKIGKKL